MSQAVACLSDEGRRLLKAMFLIDEIRGRLAEVFSLKTYKIDHVVHGAIASAAVYGAVLGATAPLFVLVLFFQRQIVSGLTAGAVKG